MKKKVTLESISSQITVLAKDMLEMKESMATKTDIAHLEKGQQEIRDDLEPLSKASDKDSETIIVNQKGRTFSVAQWRTGKGSTFPRGV